jgi:RNA polymerase subunit RPABC4/transcription elongation factor Spt4
LLEAVQKLGYKVLGEQPIYAQRKAQCGARSGCSFEALDYSTRLTIVLKQVNNIAVVATFSYEVRSYMRMTKGDRQTLLREAQAITALANERFSVSACPSCATPVTDDSHFCRRCGAPLVIEVAELEVLRLTKKSRAAYHNVLMGAMILIVAGLLVLPMLAVEPKTFKALLLIDTVMGAFGLFALLQGVRQLHFALNPKAAEPATTQPAPVFAAPLTQALPPATARASVTEGTTELLGKPRALEPVSSRVQDTGEIDDERLM